jgi:hypothetical protein
VDRGAADPLLEVAELAAVGAGHEADGLRDDGERDGAPVDPAGRRQRGRLEPARGLRVQLLGGGSLRAPRERAGALDLGDQGAEPEEDVLVAGQPLDATALEQLGQSVVGERRDVGADLGVLGVQRLQRPRPTVISMISDVPS